MTPNKLVGQPPITGWGWGSILRAHRLSPNPHTTDTRAKRGQEESKDQASDWKGPNSQRHFGGVADTGMDRQ